MFDIRKIQERVIFNAVKNASNEDTANAVVFVTKDVLSEDDDAIWVNACMRRMTDTFDEDDVKSIRMNCQCNHGMDDKYALVKELYDGASSLEEFANNDKAHAAGLFAKDGNLYLQFPFCPCPMLAKVERLESYAWCQCTTGYSKVLFEKLFGCEVDVKLLKSVKMGDDICLMCIKPLANVWNQKDE